MSSATHGHTIHMTVEQSDRMRKTVQTRLQRCRELQGQPRASRDPKDAVTQATQASLMADMAGEFEPGMSVGTQSGSMVALAMGFPYAPSTALLQDLQPISLAELQLDTHHRGRMITVRRAAPVVPLVAYSWTVVEDESGETERLEVYLHKSKRGHDMLESGSTFKIKEPYFTINEQGEATIRIHHPSDLIRNKDSDDSKKAAPAAKTAQNCKDQGNAALESKDFVDAYESYTEGLHLIEHDVEVRESLACDLLRNRAHVNLMLNRPNEAKADAVASITGIADDKHRALDAKANFRAGCAAYNLGDYQEAQQFFQGALNLTPNDRAATAYLRGIESRLHEGAKGEYNFAKINARLSQARPRVDAATFSGNTAVRESPLGGRGLFATRDIEPGELVLCEKAFCVAWSHEKEAWTAMTYDQRDDRIRAFPAGLTKAIVQKLLNDPSQIEKVMALYGDYKSIGKQLVIGEDGPVVDIFQVHDIVARNAFGPGPVTTGSNGGTENVRTASAGLWVLAAYANHACISNTRKEFLGDLLVLRATRPITAGEEITHSYDESSDYDARTAALMTTWGFTCTCPLCVAESEDGTELRKKRRQLAAEANAFVEREHAGNFKRLSVLRAERLARSINETYDDVRYKVLPRTALVPIQLWLHQAKKR